MGRRCADRGCLLIGAAMVVIGAFVLFFPEITFSASSRNDLNGGRHGRRTIVVPAAFSSALALAGGALIYNGTKIRKRETRDGVDKKAVF